MKVLTTWPEFAFAISDLDKRIENRTWLPPEGVIRTWIGIHAGKHLGGRAGKVAMKEGVDALIEQASSNGWVSVWVRDTLKFYRPGDMTDPKAFSIEDVPKSGIVALAFLESVTRKDVVTEMEVPGSSLDPGEPNYHYTAPWGFRDRFHWRFSSVLTLDKPVPCNGKQGLWEACDEIGKKVVSAVKGWKGVDKR